jgi:hypothetical protein
MQVTNRLICLVVVSLWLVGLGVRLAGAQMMTPSGPPW